VCNLIIVDVENLSQAVVVASRPVLILQDKLVRWQVLALTGRGGEDLKVYINIKVQ
jgi:hypothetical protein